MLVVTHQQQEVHTATRPIAEHVEHGRLMTASQQLERVSDVPPMITSSLRAEIFGIGARRGSMLSLQTDFDLVSSEAHSCQSTEFQSLPSRPRRIQSRKRRAISPITLFEAKPSFMPETYTNHRGIPKLFAYGSSTMSRNDHVRTGEFSVLYNRDAARRWIRLTLAITVTAESRY